MQIKGVLFDLDQTLIDFEKMKRESCKAALESMVKAGLVLDLEKGLEKLMDTYYRVGIESNKAFEEFLKEQMGFIDKKILEAGIKGYDEAKPQFVKPYPHVLEILNFLKMKNVKIGIVTDAPREKTLYRLEKMKIIHFFDVIVTSSEVPEKKPSKIPFKMALTLLSLKPPEVLYVGDSIERDIKPARSLGMKTLHIKTPTDLKKIKRFFKLQKT